MDAELQAKLAKNEITPAGAEELRKQLKNQQELERSNLTAHLEVEEKEEIHKLDKVLDEEYQDNARNFYKEALVKKLREKGTLSADKEKELMKKLTSDVEVLGRQIETEEKRQAAGLESKLAERRRRKQQVCSFVLSPVTYYLSSSLSLFSL